VIELQHTLVEEHGRPSHAPALRARRVIMKVFEVFMIAVWRARGGMVYGGVKRSTLVSRSGGPTASRYPVKVHGSTAPAARAEPGLVSLPEWRPDLGDDLTVHPTCRLSPAASPGSRDLIC
jgi:hypothetical protein